MPSGVYMGLFEVISLSHRARLIPTILGALSTLRLGRSGTPKMAGKQCVRKGNLLADTY